MGTKRAAIVITGAAGFIGSCLAGYLNEKGWDELILVDDFNRPDKIPNLEGKRYAHKVDRGIFFDWLKDNDPAVAFVFHIGARTDTTEFDYEVHRRLNVEYSEKIWHYCTAKNVPLIYASSAATYGAGEQGYRDAHELVHQLRPLNPYGISKNEFDKWALQQQEQPPFWAGLKFFNVYGPFEYHKGRMASVIWHAFNQIRDTGEVKLFRSHRPDFTDGGQLRDFVYVKDLLKICYWLMQQYLHGKAGPLSSEKSAAPACGLYNLGTGKARTFADLARAVFAALDRPPRIRYIDMPEDIREKYQYFTEADMHKLRGAGYHETFYSLEEGVKDYVQQYLLPRSG